MTDLTPTIIAKSDQMNSDDLMAGGVTIKVTKVTGVSGDQPISIHYEGDSGKPWKPCKSMRRVLVQVWGKDGSVYVGRSLTLFRDKDVTWAGAKVGGIRISHMSDLESKITLALTATRGQKKPFTVEPLIYTSPGADNKIVLDLTNEITATNTEDELKAVGAKIASAGLNPDQTARIKQSYSAQLKGFKAANPTPDDPDAMTQEDYEAQHDNITDAG